MDIFITWSGEPSRIMAECLKKLINRTIQAARPFLSSEDIRKGARWNEQIGARLDAARFAIVCLSPHNLDARWIHFEAGAISRKGKETISCLLLDVEEAAVPYPLAQFQNTSLSKEEVLKLLAAINSQLEEHRVDPDVLNDTFQSFWGDFEAGIESARVALTQSNKKSKTKPDSVELLQQLVEEGRANSKAIASLTQLVMDLRVTTHRISHLAPSMRRVSKGNHIFPIHHSDSRIDEKTLETIEAMVVKGIMSRAVASSLHEALMSRDLRSVKTFDDILRPSKPTDEMDGKKD